MLIHLIGNSHLHTFSANPVNVEPNCPASALLRCYHIGPIIAYNFIEHYLPGIITDILPKIDKTQDIICFIIGEVDCRVHLPYQADIQNRKDEDIVQECADRFARIYDKLHDYNFIVFGTHPTTVEEHDMENPDRPIYGSMSRRNKICVLWNNAMKRIAKERRLQYLSIYDDLVDEENVTKMEYMMDYCHLQADKVWPFIRKEFNKIGISL